jgi:hypothetical protein
MSFNGFTGQMLILILGMGIHPKGAEPTLLMKKINEMSASQPNRNP